jgi:hypothetical protein
MKRFRFGKRSLASGVAVLAAKGAVSGASRGSGVKTCLRKPARRPARTTPAHDQIGLNKRLERQAVRVSKTVIRR